MFFLSRLFGVEKSDVRRRDWETIDFETAGSGGEISEVRRQRADKETIDCGEWMGDT